MPVTTGGHFYERVKSPVSHRNARKGSHSKIHKISKRGKRMSNRGRR